MGVYRYRMSYLGTFLFFRASGSSRCQFCLSNKRCNLGDYAYPYLETLRHWQYRCHFCLSQFSPRTKCRRLAYGTLASPNLTCTSESDTTSTRPSLFSSPVNSGANAIASIRILSPIARKPFLQFSRSTRSKSFVLVLIITDIFSPFEC